MQLEHHPYADSVASLTDVRIILTHQTLGDGERDRLKGGTLGINSDIILAKSGDKFPPKKLEKNLFFFIFRKINNKQKSNQTIKMFTNPGMGKFSVVK